MVDKTSSSVVKVLYQMMYDIHQILINYGIKYWVIGETLLGAVKYTGIVPTIDELSVGILSKDTSKLNKLKKHLSNCGYSISKTSLGYEISREGKDYPIMLVVPYKKDEDTLVPTLKKVRDTYPESTFEQKSVFPVVEYEFGNFNVLGPNKPAKYLKDMYNEVKLTEFKHPAKPFDKTVSRKCVKLCLERSTEKVKSPRYWKVKATKNCNARICYNNFDVKMGVYVVNCSIHKARYEKFKKYAAIADVKACRVPCVLGIKFTQKVMCNMIKNKIVAKNCGMTTVEISINMSHYNCWQKLINSCQKYALILEDDVELKKDFIPKVNKLMAALEENDIDFSVFHLWNGNWAETDKKYKKILNVDNMEIVQERDYYNAGAVAYIMSRRYAEYLMERFFPIKQPQDMMMGDYYKYGNHLSLRMKYREKDDCYLSPLLDMECGGDFGTGAQTTQEHTAPSVGDRWSCDKC